MTRTLTASLAIVEASLLQQHREVAEERVEYCIILIVIRGVGTWGCGDARRRDGSREWWLGGDFQLQST